MQVYGPSIAMLYGRQDIHDRINSLGHYFNPTSSLSYKLDLSSSNYAYTQSIQAILAYFGPDPVESWRAIEVHEQELSLILLGYLMSRKDVKIFGETSANSILRVPTISFVVDGWTSQDLVEAVERESSFGFRWGTFYSNRLVEDVLGMGGAAKGVTRVSLVHYNTGMMSFQCLAVRLRDP